MKSLTLIALIVMSASFAQAECEQVAQVTAKVIRTESKAQTNECRLIVSVIKWQPSSLCGLDRGAIDKEGIEIGMINGKCAYTEEMKTKLENGTILIRDQSDVIRFDQ